MCFSLGQSAMGHSEAHHDRRSGIIVSRAATQSARIATIVTAVAVLAACTTPPPPPPPPPPPAAAPPPVVIPPRPTPPMGASKGMVIPMVATTGVRQTVNANLTPAQTTWNLRSALNVAALNCLDPKYTGLVENYGAMLKNNARELSATNRALQSEFRQRYGGTYRDVQDSYMTQVYNYFALPPAKNAFCDVAFAVSQEALAVPSGDLEVFAASALPRIESAFEDFFRAYEQYRIDLQAWDSRYGPPAVTTTVQGYVNPLDPSVEVKPGETVVDAMPATAPVSASGEAQAPVVIATGETAPDGEPVVTLPTAGPIFQSGEVVQGEAKDDDTAADDTPDPR